MHNGNEQPLDLSEISSFDDDFEGLSDGGLTQKTENTYQLAASEEFDDYLDRTTDTTIADDNELAKYLKDQGRSEEDIRNTTIPTEDGSSVSIYDLDKDEQRELVKALSEGNSDEDSEDFEDLVIEGDDEISILEAFQKSGYEGLKELLEEKGISKNEYVPTRAASMTDEEVLTYLAVKTCPTCDDDVIDNQVQATKKVDGLNKIIAGARTAILAEEQAEMQARETQDYQELAARREEGKTEFKNKLTSLSDIYGFDNEPELVSEISDYVYNYDEDYGTTEFLRDITTDPELRYKVAFFAKYGDQVIDNYKQEAKKQFEEGKKSVMSILPSKPKHSFNYASGNKKGAKYIPDISDS